MGHPRTFHTNGVRISADGGDATAVPVTITAGDCVTATVDGKTPLVCYCACPVPYDNTFSVWAAVFTTAIGPHDKPLHANALPFPLFLPLYPVGDLVIVAFAVVPSNTSAPLPVYLHWPSADTVSVRAFLDLTVPSWTECLKSWKAAVSSLSMGSWLSYAFDSTWDMKPAIPADEDVFLEEEVVPLTGGPVVNAKAVHLVSIAGSRHAQQDSDMDDDDGEEDVEEGNGHEFAQFQGMHSAGGKNGDTSSESEYTSSESGDDKDEEDDSEEDAQEDDLPE